jgi:hypothetical protein
MPGTVAVPYGAAMRTRTPSLLLAVLVLAATASAATASPRLRGNGIGPLKLGMTRTAAVATGWLAHRSLGCELAGPNRPIVYKVNGAKAPKGVRGTAEFESGRLRNLSFTKGVHTRAGVVVGKTTTKQMVKDYRALGFKATAQFMSVFNGTFVFVKRKGGNLIGGFAAHAIVTTLAIPVVPVCE